MALSPEAIADRRRMTRRVVFWRSVAAFALAVTVVAIAWGLGLGGSSVGVGGPRVATLDVTGVIVTDKERAEAIERAAKNDDVKALVVRIDSPGGTFVGSDDLHRQLKAFAEKKPIVAVIGDVAASGGYMTALAAERIYARRGSITASVGVVFQSPRVTRLMDTVGVDVDVWRSGDLKALPSPVEESPEAAKREAQVMVDRLFGLFLDMVRETRELGENAVSVIDDGRVVLGVEALELGLIDAIGDEKDARAWLDAEKGVSKDLKTSDITPPPPIERQGLLGQALAFVLGRDVARAGEGMSGLLALWRPLAH